MGNGEKSMGVLREKKNGRLCWLHRGVDATSVTHIKLQIKRRKEETKKRSWPERFFNEWRWRESNPRPKNSAAEHLQA